MSNNKRKREDEDSDDDPSYGMRQILPVASLPANFSGEPMDGMQYLFTVRCTRYQSYCTLALILDLDAMLSCYL